MSKEEKVELKNFKMLPSKTTQKAFDVLKQKKAEDENLSLYVTKAILFYEKYKDSISNSDIDIDVLKSEIKKELFEEILQELEKNYDVKNKNESINNLSSNKIDNIEKATSFNFSNITSD